MMHNYALQIMTIKHFEPYFVDLFECIIHAVVLFGYMKVSVCLSGCLLGIQLHISYFH